MDSERDRLIAGIDAFLASAKQNAEDAGMENMRIDTFGIVTICNWEEDGDEDQDYEAPIQWFESKRPHVALGILHSCIGQQTSKFRFESFLDEDDDED